ncbi:MAG TPA: nickel pincer cofactor biosynthesis protein LarC [Gaiellaceae bacterium]|nr:nickel pincer cofactor biosynthesis protein LarC [Gaiellaceae bacterium]
MSRTAYLDCVGGLAGDMLLAALLDAGGDLERLRAVPATLGLPGVAVAVERVERQGIGALHVRVEAPADAEHRDYGAIRRLLREAALPERARARALEAFARLAAVEGRIHGIPAEDVHFHELGAADTLVDVCGAFLLLDDLRVERVACSPLPFARGLTEAAHGVLPLPAPATLGLLAGAPLRGVEAEGELVTPTGAAIAAVAVDEWGPLPPLTLEAVGYGAGTRELPDRPNVLRVVLGSGAAAPGGEVVLLETNLDDLPPELVPDAVERCFAAGALDVWTVPAQMKKGRPGIVLAALARPGAEAEVARALLTETTALGVRVSRLRRYELEREERTVQVAGGTVRVKVARLDGRVVNVAPEHDDCAALAAATGRAVKSVWAEALAAAQGR